MKMWEYVVRRVLFMIPILIGVLAFSFIISHLVPGDPVGVYLGKRANDPVLRAEIEERYHLNDPLHVQFYYYITGVFQGDLGDSFVYKRPVAEIIANQLPATVELVVIASLIAIPTGIYLGIVSATKRNTFADVIARFVALVGISVPAFFLALVLQIMFVSNVQLFPLSGRISNDVSPPDSITGMYLVDSVLTLDIRAFFSSAYHIVLPAFALGFSIIGYILRMMRSSMLEVMSSEYVRSARAKGVPERAVIYKHALKNAMGPTLTISGLTIGGAISYTVFVERIFGWPGIGSFAVSSSEQLDFAGILGFTIVVTIAFLVANLIVDILYAFLDPQVRLGG
ncbi:MAG: peptide ABC transporter permease [Euryarchaeota archaeon RBG_16_62_10]|nr:MAG: peptide ABC transporter permease [Euryarchaeota archaeon RBG_16_62_10]